MSECPAGGCDYGGQVATVLGHIGGRSDSPHAELGLEDVSTEGARKGLFVGLLGVVAIVWYLSAEGAEAEESGSGPTSRLNGGIGSTEESPSEAPSAVIEVAG